MTIKIWDKDSVLELLRVNDKAVARAILALYSRQTAEEQSSEHTNVHNKIGFNKIDAPFMTSIAKALPRYNNNMTPRQLTTARKMLPKYHRQLVEIANSNQQPSVDPVVADKQVQDARQNPLYGRF